MDAGIVMIAVGAAIVARLIRRRVSPLRFEAWHVKRRHRGVAPSLIAALPENERGRLIGRVAAIEQSLIAPLTGRPCVYYAMVVEENSGLRWRKQIMDRK